MSKHAQSVAHVETIFKTVDGYQPVDKEANVSDLLTDLMHFCEDCGLDFHCLVDRAGVHFSEEMEGDV